MRSFLRLDHWYGIVYAALLRHLFGVALEALVRSGIGYQSCAKILPAMPPSNPGFVRRTCGVGQVISRGQNPTGDIPIWPRFRA